MTGQPLKLDDLPYMITTDEFADLNRTDIETARKEIRRHKDILQPIRMGRENRMLREKVELYLTLKLNKKI